jgi:hypothetical protein
MSSFGTVFIEKIFRMSVSVSLTEEENRDVLV